MYEGTRMLSYFLSCFTKTFVHNILEEVFSSKTAVWFSPDGTKLAYVQFNDTEVQLMHLQIYGPPGSIQFQYVHLVPMHYPKVCVGFENGKRKINEIISRRLAREIQQ